MQKWDYTVLEVNNRLQVQSINGNFPERVVVEREGLFGIRKEESLPELHSLLHDLGKQGWEVCGVSPYDTGIDGHINYISVILKKLLDE